MLAAGSTRSTSTAGKGRSRSQCACHRRWMRTGSYGSVWGIADLLVGRVGRMVRTDAWPRARAVARSRLRKDEEAAVPFHVPWMIGETPAPSEGSGRTPRNVI